MGKKYFLLLIACFIIFSLTGCDDSEDNRINKELTDVINTNRRLQEEINKLNDRLDNVEINNQLTSQLIELNDRLVEVETTNKKLKSEFMDLQDVINPLNTLQLNIPGVTGYKENLNEFTIEFNLDDIGQISFIDVEYIKALSVLRIGIEDYYGDLGVSVSDEIQYIDNSDMINYWYSGLVFGGSNTYALDIVLNHPSEILVEYDEKDGRYFIHGKTVDFGNNIITLRTESITIDNIVQVYYELSGILVELPTNGMRILRDVDGFFIQVDEFITKEEANSLKEDISLMIKNSTKEVSTLKEIEFILE